jgi:hypothetical protein
VICFAGVLLVAVLSYVAGWRRARFDRGEQITSPSLLVTMVVIAALAAPLVARDPSCIIATLLVGALCGYAGYFDRCRN